ncbi:hypothetical protein B0H11DRAFT_2190793 [Mycena galericulata]|nr:hypothetical protein B0H11DRAFT_2190793 [Mycena galericulata]
MPDPNPDKFGEIFALPLCQIPTNLPKMGRRPVANPDKNDAPESDKFDRFWGLGLCQSRQIWPKSTNFRPDKWVSVGTGIWWHNPGSWRVWYAVLPGMSEMVVRFGEFRGFGGSEMDNSHSQRGRREKTASSQEEASEVSDSNRAQQPGPRMVQAERGF